MRTPVIAVIAELALLLSPATALGWQGLKRLGTSGQETATGIAVDSARNTYVVGNADQPLEAAGENRGPDVFVAKLDVAGNTAWSRRVGTPKADYAAAVAVDGSGNVYVAGQTFGVFDWNTRAGSYDVFVAKLDPTGKHLWVKQLGTLSSDYAAGIAVDASGSAYVAGYTDGTFAENRSEGQRDGFVAKLDASGNATWVKQFGTAYGDVVTGVAVDAVGNSYVSGYTGGTFTGETSRGSSDAFIARVGPAGTTIVVRQFGTAASDYGMGIVVTAEGAAYVSGFTFGTFPGNRRAGESDAFVASIDPSWRIVVRQFGTPRSEQASGIAMDGSGATYVSGSTSGTFRGSANAGGRDAFVAKRDPAGNVSLVKQFGTAGDDRGSAAAVDALGNLHVAGTTTGAFPGSSSPGGTDAFAATLDTTGSIAWLTQLSTAGHETAYGIAVDGSGNTYVAGTTNGRFQGCSNRGRDDVFLAKLDVTGTTVWVTQLGTAEEEYEPAIAMDARGNFHVSGATFGAFPGHLNVGMGDAFVAKLDRAGATTWVRQFGSQTDEWLNRIAVDAGGNVYVSGVTWGKGDDAFLAKLDPEGVLLWTRQLGTSAFELDAAVAVDSEGNAYVAGSTAGTFPGAINSGGFDGFVGKFGPAGEAAWVAQLGTVGDEFVHGVAVDPVGNTYVAGTTSGAFPATTSAGGEDAFVAKLEPGGTLLWARPLGTAGNDSATGIALDASGNAFVSGYTDGAFPGTPSAAGLDGFVAKVDATGKSLWITQFGEAGDECAHAVANDPQGASYAAGSTSCGRWQPGVLAPPGDAFVVKLDADGVVQ